MLSFLNTTDETELFPLQDPEVVRLAAAVAPLQADAEEAEAARRRMLEELQPFDGLTRTEPSDLSYQTAKQHARDVTRALERATVAHALALDAATQRARTAWNEKICQAYRDDRPIRSAFTDMLSTYQRFVEEAQAAGVPGVFNVPQLFVTAEEVASREDYARRQMGLE